MSAHLVVIAMCLACVRVCYGAGEDYTASTGTVHPLRGLASRNELKSNGRPIPKQVLRSNGPSRDIVVVPAMFVSGGQLPIGVVRLEIARSSGSSGNFGFLQGYNGTVLLGNSSISLSTLPVAASDFVRLNRTADPSTDFITISPVGASPPSNASTSPEALRSAELGIEYTLRVVFADSDGTEAPIDFRFVIVRDCVMSQWTEWSSCTAFCGGGTQNRTRNITLTAIGEDDGAVRCGNTFERNTCSGEACDAGPFIQQESTITGITAIQLISPNDATVRARLRVAQAALMPLTAFGDPYPPELVRIHAVNGITHVDDSIERAREDIGSYATWLVSYMNNVTETGNRIAGSEAGEGHAPPPTNSTNATLGGSVPGSGTGSERRLSAGSMAEMARITARGRRELQLL